MGQHKSLLVKFWATTFLILTLLGLLSFTLKSQEAYFSYDMSEGDTVLVPYFTGTNIDAPYTLTVVFPQTDSAFSVSVMSNSFWNDTLYFNHQPKFYPFTIRPQNYLSKAEMFVYDDNYTTYKPAIAIDVTDGDNSIIFFILKVR